ncbi:MAG: LCP family protein [Anaerovoracaceae bacterium]|jgi:LCP family protein required for cell wall assembly
MRSDKHVENSESARRILKEREEEIAEFNRAHGDELNSDTADIAPPPEETAKAENPEENKSSEIYFNKDDDLEKQKALYRRLVEEEQNQGKVDRSIIKDVPEDGFRDPNWKGAGARRAAAAAMAAEAGGEKSERKSIAEIEEEVSGEDPQRSVNEVVGLPPDPPKKKRNRRKTILIVVISLLVILACIGAGFLIYLHSLTGKIEQDDTDLADFDINDRVAKELDGYRDIAILGVDARKQESIKGSRSDAIIVARINEKTGRIQLISVMRDSYLQIEGEDGSKGLDKITHAHAYGGAIDTCKSLNRNLDLNISEYLVFNWKAVADLVDKVGGVTVDIDYDEIYDMNQYGYESAENVDGTYTPIYQTGKTKLNGAAAVTYCRIRKNSGGDPGRGSRYKEVMGQLLKKARNMDPSDLNDTANKILPELRTNMKKTAVLSMMSNMSSYKIGASYGWPQKYNAAMINSV